MWRSLHLDITVRLASFFAIVFVVVPIDSLTAFLRIKIHLHITHIHSHTWTRTAVPALKIWDRYGPCYKWKRRHVLANVAPEYVYCGIWQQHSSDSSGTAMRFAPEKQIVHRMWGEFTLKIASQRPEHMSQCKHMAVRNINTHELQTHTRTHTQTSPFILWCILMRLYELYQM